MLRKYKENYGVIRHTAIKKTKKFSVELVLPYETRRSV